MHPPIPNPTETSLGNSHQREDFLWQEARDSRVARWVRAIAKVAVILSVVVLAAWVVVGLGETIRWLATYLIPTLVLLGVVFVVVGLLVHEGGKVYDTRYPHK